MTSNKQIKYLFLKRHNRQSKTWHLTREPFNKTLCGKGLLLGDSFFLKSKGILCKQCHHLYETGGTISYKREQLTDRVNMINYEEDRQLVNINEIKDLVQQMEETKQNGARRK